MFYADPALGGSGRTYTNDAAPVTGFFNGGHNPLFELALQDFGNMLNYFVAQIGAGADTTATSSTSNGTGTGDKTFTVPAGRSYVPGMYGLASYNSVPSEQMYFRVKAYSGTTLVVTVIRSTVAGTRNDWSIHIVPTRLTNNLGVYTYAELLQLTDMVPGDIVAVSDVGPRHTAWQYSTDWRPIGGSLVLAQLAGTVASPLATINGVTAATFALSLPAMPANLLRAGSRVAVRARVRKTDSSSTANAVVALGSFGQTANDPQLARAQLLAGGPNDIWLDGEARLGSASNFSGTRELIPQGTGKNENSSESINVGVVNRVSIGIASANGASFFQLINISVEVFP